ncbi:hypothetical protein UT5_21240 [Ferrigenium sp. UT5]
MVFSSLFKRSNVPGMRSGFVAGDAKILEKFALYRTYHGCAMNPAIQAATIAAWNDEAHVAENRRLYAQKFEQVIALLAPVLPVRKPDAGFYLWLPTPIPDTAFAQALHRDYNVSVLPGSFLTREAHGINPGANFIRLALVADLDETLEAARRIAEFTLNLTCEHAIQFLYFYIRLLPHRFLWLLSHWETQSRFSVTVACRRLVVFLRLVGYSLCQPVARLHYGELRLRLFNRTPCCKKRYE